MLGFRASDTFADEQMKAMKRTNTLHWSSNTNMFSIKSHWEFHTEHVFVMESDPLKIVCIEGVTYLLCNNWGRDKYESLVTKS